MHKNTGKWQLGSLAVLILLSGCTLGSMALLPDSAYEPFIAPTLAPTPLPTNTPTPVPTVQQTNTESGSVVIGSDTSGADCTDSLQFISDLTIPDGTVVVAGSTLDKQWEIENNGTCNWEEGYQIRLISGEQMGVSSEQALIPARSGSRATIRIVFTAPEEPGAYRSAWQAYNPQGTAFGDPFYIDITVE